MSGTVQHWAVHSFGLNATISMYISIDVTVFVSALQGNIINKI